MAWAGGLVPAVFAGPAEAAALATGPVGKSGVNVTAIAIFSAFVVLTLGITYWAARRVRSRRDFYVAGSAVTPWQNGLAIAGDFMSAATFLGITGALYFSGIDAYILGVGIMVSWPIILMVIAERFRNLGRFTFIDVVSYRLEQRPVRIMASCVSLGIVLFYLIAQMVGAGTLIQILFGLDYRWAVVIVGVLMVVYVAFGGMIATTWVQLIKACLLLLGGSYLAFALLAEFDFSPDALMRAATERHAQGAQFLVPGGWLGDSVSVITVGLTMMFGVMGLPHILMRFFTVKDAVSARKSVFYATSIMAYFYVLILVIGVGAVALLWGKAEYLDEAGRLAGGGNMVAIHLSHVLGGNIVLGFMAAVSFATILAVVAGLTLAGAGTIAHDLYAHALRGGAIDGATEVKLTRYSSITIGILAVGLGMAFEGQNVAVTAALALALAASINFPIIFLAMYWPGLTTRGAVVGGYTGLVVAFVLILLSPGVMVAVLGWETALFPYAYPTIITLPLTFLTAVLVSLWDRSERAARDRALFADQMVQSETGLDVLQAARAGPAQ